MLTKEDNKQETSRFVDGKFRQHVLAFKNSGSVLPKNHFVIYSSIYYNVSKLYSLNSMAILLNAQKDINPKKLNYRCYSKNETETSSSKLQIRMATKDPSTNCKWEVFIANCTTVLNPTFFGITSEDAKKFVEISYDFPIFENHPVVMCYAPMVYESRWQQLIFATEIYRYYGVDMQVQYVNSAMKQIMDILRIYSAKNWIKIHEFAYFEFDNEIIKDIGFDPMKEIISRNQQLAYSDCVMKYREAAEFIIIADIDEIMFPKQKNYFQEFSKWSILHPNAAAFIYHRSYAKINTPNEFTNFSLINVMESLKIADSLFMGKSVIRTKNVEAPWIHWPGLYNGNVVTLDPKDGRIYHIQIAAEKIRVVKAINRLGKSEDLKNLKPFNPITKSDMISMNESFISSFSKFINFKSNFIYANIIFECFKQNENWNLESCYTPFQCEIPSNISNFECEIVRRNYSKNVFNQNSIFYKFESNYYWEKNKEKCVIFRK